MAIREYRPVTPGRRGLKLVDRSALWKGRPEKSLVRGKARTGGRDNSGHITAAHRGGGHRKRVRQVDFRRSRPEEAVVERLEYDPGRTAFIALVRYPDGSPSYILAPSRLSPGDRVVSGDRVDPRPGNAMPLRSMPSGTTVHNIELKPGAGGRLVRSAGGGAQYQGSDRGYALLRLPSGEVRRVPADCRATVGSLSNPDQMNVNLGKAGRSRWKGRRPHVRGVAMNPVDHPHGGGEGKTSGGRHPVNRKGKPTKGYKTRRRTDSDRLIVRRRSARRRR